MSIVFPVDHNVIHTRDITDPNRKERLYGIDVFLEFCKYFPDLTIKLLHPAASVL